MNKSINNDSDKYPVDKLPLISFLFRASIASAYLYAGLGSLLDPNSWIGFLPSFIRNSGYGLTALTIFSIIEVILSIWIISGKKAYLSSALSSLMMFLIIVFNLELLDIVFRDIPILFASMGLMVMYKNNILN